MQVRKTIEEKLAALERSPQAHQFKKDLASLTRSLMWECKDSETDALIGNVSRASGDVSLLDAAVVRNTGPPSASALSARPQRCSSPRYGEQYKLEDSSP
jgi:hypothetical protein